MPTFFKSALSSARSNRGFTHTPGFWASGFTLTELLVVIAIATILMTALIIQQNRWNDSLAVSTQAYEMALTIRQAQIYSLGVKEYTGPVSIPDKFNVGYGVYFDSATPNQYVFFVDLNGDREYDANEALEIKTFNKGVQIYDICGTKRTGYEVERCSSQGGGGGNVSKIAIIFYRPDPKPQIEFLNGGSSASTNIVPSATIYVRGPSSGSASFYSEIFGSGQVSVTQGVSVP